MGAFSQHLDKGGVFIEVAASSAKCTHRNGMLGWEDRGVAQRLADGDAPPGIGRVRHIEVDWIIQCQLSLLDKLQERYSGDCLRHRVCHQCRIGRHHPPILHIGPPPRIRTASRLAVAEALRPGTLWLVTAQRVSAALLQAPSESSPASSSRPGSPRCACCGTDAEHCVCELMRELGVSQSRMSRHGRAEECGACGGPARCPCALAGRPIIPPPLRRCSKRRWRWPASRKAKAA